MVGLPLKYSVNAVREIKFSNAQPKSKGHCRMIPISDASRRPVRLPIATIAIIVINALVFLLELAGGDAFINQWSFVPAHIVAGRGAITIFTAIFMHAAWRHIAGT